ncbi:MAG TPA: beta-ketoacyl-[acyl-carrier-protein] synthase family protein, partial [Longimicrobium sp.]|nr:beta-ketoacyl-[acyl-carrier-protein] synthase family protein [Longimicrobium sp.]
MKGRTRIVITGMGVCSAIGADAASSAEALEAGRTGLQRLEGLLPGATLWAGLVPDQVFGDGGDGPLDRTGQLALAAAAEACRDAGLENGAWSDPARVGVAFGTSHGGRTQLDRFVERGESADDPEVAERLLVRAAHHTQTEVVAHRFGVRGPILTTSSACSSGSGAITHACALLRSGKADLVLAGGADAFSKLTGAGFGALKAVANGPCSPFSERIGLSLGEGAGFVILETLEHAQARGARIRAELLGYGLSWDAFHITEPDPSGSGLLRALRRAARDAGIRPREVDYVHAHGTGTRANDGAESLAVRRFFEEDEAVAPVSATKSFTGHTLGASSVLGLVFTLLGMERDFLPPTVNFGGPRAGCELDVVPNQARPGRIQHFAVNASGFGGTNAVLVGGRFVADREAMPLNRDDVVVSGLGVVSALGCGVEPFLQGLRGGASGIEPPRPGSGDGQPWGGRVTRFEPQRAIPSVDVRRMDKLVQYAIAAASEALRDAGLSAANGERVGLLVGTTRGAAGSFEKYLASLRGARWQNASPIYFPNLVMSSVGGQVARVLGLKGASSTVISGTTCGLQALAHGFELLRQDSELDALVVLAVDELSGLFQRLRGSRGGLAADGAARPYGPSATGLVPGEGAAAVVLERSGLARARRARPLARVCGYGLTSDGRGPNGLEPEGEGLERAARLALAESGLSPGGLDAVYGHGRGVPEQDAREIRAMERLLVQRVPVGCVLGNTGVAEAASGLFSVAAALLGLTHGEVYPIVS